MLMAFAAAQAQVTPGYLGKKNVFTYDYQTIPNFAEEMFGSSNISLLRIMFKNRHFLGYERIISEKHSLKFELGYSRTSMKYQLYEYDYMNFEKDDDGLIPFKAYSFGFFYRNYGFLAPLDGYISYGIRLFNVSTPEGAAESRQFNGSTGEYEVMHDKKFEAETRYTLGLFIQSGKSRVINDAVYIDSYFEFGITYFNALNTFHDTPYETPGKAALARLFRYNLINVGISIGLVN